MQGGKLELLAELKGHSDRIWRAAWAPSGKAIATCGGDKDILIWTLSGDGTWRHSNTLDGVHTRTVRSVRWSPNGRLLASCSFDGTAAVWENKDGDFECISQLEGHENEVKSVAWSASGQLLATCSRDKSVWIWEAGGPDRDFECISVLHGHTQDVKSVVWHPHDDVLFSASYDNTLKQWTEESDDWYCTQTLSGHGSTVWDLAFDASGNRLVSCGEDGSLLVWARHASPDVAAAAASALTVAQSALASAAAPTTPVISSLPPPEVSVSAAVVAAVRQSVAASPLVENTGAGQWVPVSLLPSAHTRAVFSVSWSKSGFIASASGDNSFVVYKQDEPANAALPSFSVFARAEQAHAGDVNCVAWCPSDSSLLASVGDDTVLRIWRFEAGLDSGNTDSPAAGGANASSREQQEDEDDVD